MARSKTAEGAVFYVFDRFLLDTAFYLRLEDTYDAQDCDPYTGSNRVVCLTHAELKSAKDLAKYEAKQLKLGYEGVMRRSINGTYKHGRSTLKEGGLIAIKRFVDAEAVVLDTYEQQENTNEKTVNELGRSKRSSHKAGKIGKGTLGGFTVMMANEYWQQAGLWSLKTITANAIEKKLAFNIGTGVGLTDAVRAELWTKRKSLVGKIVKFRYQKVGTKDAPRLPIFLGFRSEKDL
jgi:DNA ligase-1